MDRRGGTGEVVNLIDLDVERKGHVVPQQFEPRVAHEMRNVRLAAGEEIIDAQNFVAFQYQSVA